MHLVEEQVKTCNSCGEVKPLDAFRKNRGQCKECIKRIKSDYDKHRGPSDTTPAWPSGPFLDWLDAKVADFEKDELGLEDIARIVGVDSRVYRRIRGDDYRVSLAVVDKALVAFGEHPADIYPVEYASVAVSHGRLLGYDNGCRCTRCRRAHRAWKEQAGHPYTPKFCACGEELADPSLGDECGFCREQREQGLEPETYRPVPVYDTPPDTHCSNGHAYAEHGRQANGVCKKCIAIWRARYRAKARERYATDPEYRERKKAKVRERSRKLAEQDLGLAA